MNFAQAVHDQACHSKTITVAIILTMTINRVTVVKIKNGAVHLAKTNRTIDQCRMGREKGKLSLHNDWVFVETANIRLLGFAYVRGNLLIYKGRVRSSEIPSYLFSCDIESIQEKQRKSKKNIFFILKGTH